MHAASIRRELLTLGLIAGVAIAFADGASKTLQVAISTAETSFASLTGQKRFALG